MDERQFDTLVRGLAAGTSRRTGIRLLAGAGAALLALARGSDFGALARRGTAGPGDPCRHDAQCLGADGPMFCDWNGYDSDGGLNCCTYEGSRCGFDEACCGLASCIGGFCSGGGFSSAGSGGFASANAQGGTISIGDINSGGNVGNTIRVGNTQGSVRVSGGSVSNTTDISASADGGLATADASGGSGDVGGDGSIGSTYADPGDPCWSGVQCVAADTALTCDYNNSTDDYRCCAYEGDRCGWDGGCCGWLSCNDNGFCTSQSWGWGCTGQGCACQLYRDPECRASCPLYDPCDAGLVCTGTSDVTGTCVPSQSSGCTWEGCACYRGWSDADPCDQGLVCCLNGSPVMGGNGGCVPQWQC